MSDLARTRWITVGVGAATLFAGGAVTMTACAATRHGASAARRERIEASPNHRDGKFVNTLGKQTIHFWKAMGRWLAGGSEHRVPRQPIEVVARSARDFSAPPASGLRVTWLGHSTLLVEVDGHRVLVDPVWAERASPFGWMGPSRFYPPPLPLAELPAVDAVLISHDHYDHLDQSTIEALGDRVPLYAVPLGVGAYLEQWGVPAGRIAECDWWDGLELGDLTLTATPARHFSGRSLVMANQDQTLWSGWVIAGPQHRVYYSGDTANFAGFTDIGARLGPFDAALIEAGAYNQLWADVHLGPEQAVEARLALGSGLLIPVHWGTFDLALHGWTEPVERLLVAAEMVGIPVAVPRPGASVEPAKPPALVRWWPEVPWQTAMEAPVVSSGLETGRD